MAANQFYLFLYQPDMIVYDYNYSHYSVQSSETVWRCFAPKVSLIQAQTEVNWRYWDFSLWYSCSPRAVELSWALHSLWTGGDWKINRKRRWQVVTSETRTDWKDLRPRPKRHLIVCHYVFFFILFLCTWRWWFTRKREIIYIFINTSNKAVSRLLSLSLNTIMLHVFSLSYITSVFLPWSTAMPLRSPNSITYYWKKKPGIDHSDAQFTKFVNLKLGITFQTF